MAANTGWIAIWQGNRCWVSEAATRAIIGAAMEVHRTQLHCSSGPVRPRSRHAPAQVPRSPGGALQSAFENRSSTAARWLAAAVVFIQRQADPSCASRHSRLDIVFAAKTAAHELGTPPQAHGGLRHGHMPRVRRAAAHAVRCPRSCEGPPGACRPRPARPDPRAGSLAVSRTPYAARPRPRDASDSRRCIIKSTRRRLPRIRRTGDTHRWRSVCSLAVGRACSQAPPARLLTRSLGLLAAKLPL